MSHRKADLGIHPAILGHIRPQGLDGYALERDEYGRELNRFAATEPVLEGVHAVEDDLAEELRKSDLPDAEEILRTLDNSADAFRREDFNGCLSNARVALQTLAMSIAQVRLTKHPSSVSATLRRFGRFRRPSRASCRA
jgi:hypothetical protein